MIEWFLHLNISYRIHSGAWCDYLHTGKKTKVVSGKQLTKVASTCVKLGYRLTHVKIVAIEFHWKVTLIDVDRIHSHYCFDYLFLRIFSWLYEYRNLKDDTIVNSCISMATCKWATCHGELSLNLLLVLDAKWCNETISCRMCFLYNTWVEDNLIVFNLKPLLCMLVRRPFLQMGCYFVVQVVWRLLCLFACFGCN